MRTLHGLYVITPETRDTGALCRMVEGALLGGANAVQFRQKELTEVMAEQQARALHEVCARFGKPLIINDSIELMLAVGAEGVHLGRDDGDPIRARQRLGPDVIIGVSCYNDFDRVLRFHDSVDHVAFGSLFDSPTKPAAVHAPLSLFARAAALGINTVGIGGIDRHNAARAGAAGADAIAVISAVFGADDIATAAREIIAAFEIGKAAGPAL